MELSKEVVAVFSGLFVTILTALVTYWTTLRQKEIERKKELHREQKYKFFYPFKFSAKELLGRVSHIEKRIFENKFEMVRALSLNIEDRQLEWFYSEGYFLVSTIYLHCIMYAKVKILQDEYPYLQAKIDKKKIKKILSTSQFNRSNSALKKDDYISEDSNIFNELNNVKFYDFSKSISFLRVSTIGRGGILYSLQTSFGSLVLDQNNKVIDYNIFCKKLLDKDILITLLPLINFWRGVISNNDEIDEIKIQKIRNLIVALNIIEASEINF